MVFSLRHKNKISISIGKRHFTSILSFGCLSYYHFIESHVKPVLDKFLLS